MTARLFRLAAALLTSLALALPAHAGSWSVDFTDLWWNPAESGWGVNVVQQGDTLFLTFFIYGADNAARWIVAPDMKPTSTQPPGTVRFSGDIYQTKGPWYGTAFDPAAVEREKVGSAVVTFNSAELATLSYTVSNVPVVKVIQRQLVRTNSVAGTYVGGLAATTSQCVSSSDNGPQYYYGNATVEQTVTQVTFKVDFYTRSSLPATCTFTGDYAQKGRLATVSNGTFACAVNGSTGSGNNAGTFTMTALDAQMNGFHATFSGADQYCTYNGRFGGTRSP